jgi:hypothetical protein
MARRRASIPLMATALFLAGAFVVASSHFVGADRKWPLVTLQAKAGGKCIALARGKAAGKTVVAAGLVSCRKGDAVQQFEVITRKGGFALRGLRLQACLEAAKAGPGKTGTVGGQKCRYQPAQLWSRQAMDKQWFLLVSRMTGLCLTAGGGAGKAPIAQVACAKGAKAVGQMFRTF